MAATTVVAVDASLESGATVEDWVEARPYLTLGDVLLVDAQRERDRSLASPEPLTQDHALALLRFGGAGAAYRFAYAVGHGSAEPSLGRVRERDHTAAALFSSSLAVATVATAIRAVAFRELAVDAATRLAAACGGLDHPKDRSAALAELVHRP